MTCPCHLDYKNQNLTPHTVEPRACYTHTALNWNDYYKEIRTCYLEVVACWRKVYKVKGMPTLLKRLLDALSEDDLLKYKRDFLELKAMIFLIPHAIANLKKYGRNKKVSKRKDLATLALAKDLMLVNVVTWQEFFQKSRWGPFWGYAKNRNDPNLQEDLKMKLKNWAAIHRCKRIIARSEKISERADWRHRIWS